MQPAGQPQQLSGVSTGTQLQYDQALPMIHAEATLRGLTLEIICSCLLSAALPGCLLSMHLVAPAAKHKLTLQHA